jgi:prolyl-tRNA synthetase
MQETLKILDVYSRIMRDVMALPVITGEKTRGERFPGADSTFTCETMMSDKRALQAGTSHFLGQNFAKAFEIRFQNKQGDLEYAWTTSWGISTRLIGAIIMTHSDDDGLILPPRVAPVKTVLLPIGTDETLLHDTLLPEAQRLAEHLGSAGLEGVVVDRQFHLRPGDRFFHHLQRGVPLRLELGQREMEKGAVRAVRRDTGERSEIPLECLAERVTALLTDIQSSLYERALAFREEHTEHVSDYESFKRAVEERSGFLDVFFDGTPDDERWIREETGATPRCIPLEGASSLGTCFYTGRPGRRTIFAKAY